ncbi:MAG: hypothetical protein GEU81_15310 [Nitriliruptorales bacterium]|nr:hypothetical protein [Nitriliruptorales bacterium]
MASLSALRDALKATITGAIPELHVYDTVPDNAQLPALIVTPRSAAFAEAMGRGVDSWEFELVVLTQYGDPATAQDALDRFVTGSGTASIREAIWNNRSLGLTSTHTYVAAMSDYNARMEIGGTEVVGGKLRCLVLTTD